MISTFPPPWNFKLTWTVHEDKMTSKFPPPWKVKLILNVHTGTTLSKSPPPWNFKSMLTVHTHPHGTWNWLGVSTRGNLFPSMSKLLRFRNYHDSQTTTVHKLYRDSETSAATITHLNIPLGNCCGSDTMENYGSCGIQRSTSLVSESAFLCSQIFVSESAFLCFQLPTLSFRIRAFLFLNQS